MIRSLIVGNGEVGSSLARVLGGVYEVEVKDVEEREIAPGFAVMHVCLNYIALGRERWLQLVREYVRLYRPDLVDVCSTVPPGLTASLGGSACHSTTRGLHPHLEAGLRAIPKHIGGKAAERLAAYYNRAGVKTVTHRRPDTTEVAHIAHLLDYGLQIASADMRNQLCRLTNTDYMESVVRYTDTHNSGFRALDMPSKVRMSLTPPNGKVGGHCVIEAAKLAKEYGFQHPLVEYLSAYNDGK